MGMSRREKGEFMGQKAARASRRETTRQGGQANSGRKANPVGADGPGGPREGAAWPRLTPEQRTLAAEHIGLVGVHLRKRVPTPRQPMRHREYEDLFQEGCVALVRAAARYNPDQDGEFAAYALLRIRGAVHVALHERFSTIHVPTRGAAAAKGGSRPYPRPAQEPLYTLANELAIESPSTREDGAGGETIRHALRRRYEQAVQAALTELRARRWRRRNPCAIMARVAAERVLISEKVGRTPLRQIAREAGVSSGRASAYEQQLVETVGEHFRRDVQVPLLIRFASEDPDRFEGVVDCRRRERLLEEELRAFEVRFTELDGSARAEIVYKMIERSTPAVVEVARNLYRLTQPDGTETLPAVA